MKKYQDDIKLITNLAEYIIEHNATIRQTAKVFSMSKSTVHYLIKYKLKDINDSLFVQTKIILCQNFSEKHIRGGNATKMKYNGIRNNCNANDNKSQCYFM